MYKYTENYAAAIYHYESSLRLIFSDINTRFDDLMFIYFSITFFSNIVLSRGQIIKEIVVYRSCEWTGICY